MKTLSGRTSPATASAATGVLDTAGPGCIVQRPGILHRPRRADLAAGRLSRSFFVDSGTEAVETSGMTACIHTGRGEIIALRHACSGRSILATNLTAHAPCRPVATSVAGIEHAVAPGTYRSPFGDFPEEEAVEPFARALEEVIRPGPSMLITESATADALERRDRAFARVDRTR